MIVMNTKSTILGAAAAVCSHSGAVVSPLGAVLVHREHHCVEQLSVYGPTPSGALSTA
jgi:hypothetical protein